MPSSTSPGPAPAPARPPRRIPWALVPIAVAGAYALVHGLLRHRPTLEAMVPSDAFVTWRWRDLETYDQTRTGGPLPDGSPPAPASDVLGAELNVPQLPGVDRGGPLLEVWLDPARRVDPRYFVLPVESPRALEDRYRSPDLLERHARYLEVHGDWAACAWDRDAVRLAGRGDGILAPSLGERWSVTADWPRLVDFALQPDQARGEPYRSALEALGFSLGGLERTATPQGPQLAVKAGRVPFVRDAWTRATLRSFDDRVRVDLVPSAAGDLDEILAAAAAEKGGGPEEAVGSVPRPPSAEAWVSIPHARGRRALALALWYAGVAWPQAVVAKAFAALHLDRPGPLAVWSETSPGPFAMWTLALAGPVGALPDLPAFGLPTAPTRRATELAEGAVPLLAPFGGVPPAGQVAREAMDGGRQEVVAIGLAARTLAERVARTGLEAAPAATPPAGAPHATLATFYLSALSAQRLLGRATEPTGLLAALGGAAIEGEVWTDGRALVVELRKVAK